MNYINLFKNAINKERLSHLYLISGNKGTPKLELVYDVLYELFKTHNKDINLLEKIQNNKLSNIYEIEPSGASIKKSQIQELQEEFSKTSLEKGYRSYIIKEANLLTISAANSLLKFLEEPENKKTIGFLLTENIDKIIPTILSRSQIIHLPSKTPRQLYIQLIELEFSKIDSLIISNLNENIDESFKLIEDQMYQDIKKTAINFLKTWANDEKITIYTFEIENTVLQNKEAYILFLNILFILLHGSFLYEGDTIDEINFLTLIEKNKKLKLINLIQEQLKNQNYYVNNQIELLKLAIEGEKI